MAALSLGAAPFVTSCSDDEEADEWNATYVYLQREDYLVSNVKTFNLTHDAEGNIIPYTSRRSCGKNKSHTKATKTTIYLKKYPVVIKLYRDLSL